MSEKAMIAVGLIIGLLFGMSGISTLFDFLNKTMEETEQKLANLGAMSTLVLLIIAIVLIVKVRVISSLIVGAIIGAILNVILEMNGIHIFDEVFSQLLQFIQ
ncbi:conserved hypothetical protein [Ferroglobus placidus DSM 10642]|uniref:Uncharacterized protein n=1 Tax=Ferroglobus placidus (strain DSM 10642 / AEDII12DO) TaxID=589924 RepID=D3S2H6_FERPA|nr:hypothetical protein [Ferroglobus placidus]ADC64506.1 conserved hypothetical protein [Ferroglobus placidus DSM 10642]